MRSTFIKITFVIKIFVLSNFDWPFYTGFTVHLLIFSYPSVLTFVLGALRKWLSRTGFRVPTTYVFVQK